jgi:hypothetical protein
MREREPLRIGDDGYRAWGAQRDIDRPQAGGVVGRIDQYRSRKNVTVLIQQERIWPETPADPEDARHGPLGNRPAGKVSQYAHRREPVAIGLSHPRGGRAKPLVNPAKVQLDPGELHASARDLAGGKADPLPKLGNRF